jgi:ACS family tartrate transporter-like MFS transporter
VAVVLLPAIASAQIADRTRHSVALRLLPFLFLLYIVNFVDRTNIAYAAIGMSRDLGFSDQVFGLGMAIFFPSYLAFQIPGALLVERWSARRMISATMIAWGLLTSLTALIHTPVQLYAARLVLGAAESAFFPGVIVYLSHWFTREDRAKATGNFMAAIPVSFVIGSPIAGWMIGYPWLGLAGWRWLFIIEGAPAVALGIAAFFFLPDWPQEATWLNSEQKQWLGQALQREKALCGQKISIGAVLKSRIILLLAAAGFLNNLLIYGFSFWFPTLLKRLSGFSDVRVGLLGALPYLAGFLAMQVNGWHSDRHGERRWHSAIPLFIAAIGLFGCARGKHPFFLSMLLFMVVGLDWAFLSPFWSIPTDMFNESAAAAAVGLMASSVNLAGFVGPYAFGYLHSQTGSFSDGLAGIAVAALAAATIIVLTPIGRCQRQPGDARSDAAGADPHPSLGLSPDPVDEAI